MTRKPRLCRRFTIASSAGEEMTSSPPTTTAMVGTCGFGGIGGFSGTFAVAICGGGASCAACAAGRSRSASTPACDARAAGAPDASVFASADVVVWPGGVVGAAASVLGGAVFVAARSAAGVGVTCGVAGGGGAVGMFVPGVGVVAAATVFVGAGAALMPGMRSRNAYA